MTTAPAGAGRRVVVLRHGRTAHNADGRIQGQLDTPLDELGRAQAEALGTVFASDPPAVVISSDLSRARETAQAVCDHVGLPLVVDTRLRETYFGQWQGQFLTDIEQTWPDEFAAWRVGRAAPVGGETMVQVGARAAASVEEHLAAVPSGGMLLVVAHGGTGRALAGTLCGFDPATWWSFAPLGNTCWTTLVEWEAGWRLERHNAGLGPLVGAPTGAA